MVWACALSEKDFEPALSQLDTLVQSIIITPTATDFSVTAGEPQHGQILAVTDIFGAPVGGETIGALDAGEAVVVNGMSSDGRRSRILCLDGTTGSCWIDADVVQTNDLAEVPVFHSGGMPEVGQVVQITAVSDNPIYAEPNDKGSRIGTLLAGEAVEIFGPDETGAWLNIACPRGIGAVCWVVSDTVVNEPTGFFAGDDWQDINGRNASSRRRQLWHPCYHTRSRS